MTPEEARELRQHATTTHPAALAEFMDWQDVADALQTIATLETHYAAETTTGGRTWRYLNAHGTTPDPNHADWHPERHNAERAAAQHTKKTGTPARVTARRVSPPDGNPDPLKYTQPQPYRMIAPDHEYGIQIDNTGTYITNNNTRQTLKLRNDDALQLGIDIVRTLAPRE